MRKSVLLASIIWILLTGLSYTMSRYRTLQSRRISRNKKGPFRIFFSVPPLSL